MIDKDGRASESAGRRRHRRSADPSRRHDPELTRQSIMDAANEEFGEHGFKGARVERIAAAAGVNHSLITYHFGGKQGLYDAVTERWITKGATMMSGAEPFAEIVRDFVRWEHDEKVSIIRTLVRGELDGKPPPPEAWAARLLDVVDETRRRQARGEIRADLDVGALTLAFFTAAMAPEILPQLTATVTGADPASAEFIDRYAEQLARLVHTLVEVPQDGPGNRTVPPQSAGETQAEDHPGN
ncbi:TetR/AcrR family transcriptional regulator [Streptomyces sp. SAI-127]|uniref:TetR/AcrR family transcriptional regulator n=1 Tax=Streptomyces sp. SAI-127 TaxID=2940543 RepID=UPI0024752AA8|nr:TetR/AcrR family transcriptional regulator [Streptomyces sp. SAI-127]MDH6484532.1 TetR/AcrR family transcriptional regulator [Streptomyces sp. SAI-127]